MVTNSLHKMREALESIRNLAFEVQDMNGEGDVKTSLPPKWVIDVVNFALSEPPRQCDVGTAQEQSERFGKLCGKYYNEEETCNEKCPLASLPIIHGFPRCQAYWAQTPYAEEEGGAE